MPSNIHFKWSAVDFVYGFEDEHSAQLLRLQTTVSLKFNGIARKLEEQQINWVYYWALPRMYRQFGGQVCYSF